MSNNSQLIFLVNEREIIPPKVHCLKAMTVFSASPKILNSQRTQIIKLSIAAAYWPYIELGALVVMAYAAATHLHVPCSVK